MDVSSSAGVALGLPANYGTSPGAIKVQGVNAFVTNSPAVTAVSGAFATGSMVDLLTVIGTKGAGTAAANSLLAGGVYNSALPSLSTGNQAALQLTSSGLLRADLASVNAVTVLTGAGAVGTGSARVAVGQDATTVAGSAAVVAVSVAPVTATNPAIVVDLRPDSPGIIALGQATKANSVPVTIASDQYVDPCQSPNVAKSSAVIGITSATTTALVAVSGSTTIYACGYDFTISEVITTANTLAFEYGTGTACATSPTALTGTFGAGGVVAAAPLHISYAPGHTVFKTPASSGLCALTAIGASGTFQGVITYVQQ
jgi:hypothetical protein